MEALEGNVNYIKSNIMPRPFFLTQRFFLVISSFFWYSLEAIKMTNNQQLKTKNSLPRPPIVVVMGHVDHGKTTLLDYIRKTTVAIKEAGGITQSIGAYEITHTPISINQPNQHESAPAEGRKITFIDTPGHEAFSKMRARGAKVADLAILVVAADDGVKPQTNEVIQVLKQTETPFVVAINKIDKNNADPEKVKQELMQAGVLLEGFGGNVSWQAISAKTGEGVNELLDLLLLTAEVENLTYNPEAKCSGVVIEAKMDSRRGLTAIAIVRNGILKVGDEITTQSAVGKIKILENFLGERVEELFPSSPALILGFESLPQIGEEFWSGEVNLAEIKPIPAGAVAAITPISQPVVPSVVSLIVKADVSGSLEAVTGIIKTIPGVEVLSESVGDITDGDVKAASSNGASIVGFNVRITKPAENLAKAQNVLIITSEVIYELVKILQDKAESLKKPIQSEIEILKVFSHKGKRQLIGGRVNSGKIKNKSELKIIRGDNEVGQGRVTNLQSQKQDAREVNLGEECGILFESETTVEVGDKLTTF